MVDYELVKGMVANAFKTATVYDLEIMALTLRICIKQRSTIKEIESVVKVIENEIERRSNETTNPQG